MKTSSKASPEVALMTEPRIRLLMDPPSPHAEPQPFFGSISMNLDIVVDRNCQTAWTDGVKLGFNPDYVRTLPFPVRVTLVAHEVLHPALLHIYRREGRDPLQWNIACDKVVNRILLDAGFELPPNVYVAQDEEIGKSAEWIYENDRQKREAKQKQQPQPQPGQGDGQDGGGESQDEQNDSDQDGDGTGNDQQDDQDGDSQDGTGDEDADDQQDGQGGGGEGEDEETVDDLFGGEMRDAPTGKDENGNDQPTEQDWIERTMIAATQAAMAGLMPGGAQLAVDRAIQPKIDPRSVLLRFMQERQKNEYNWQRPNKRYSGLGGVMLPSLWNESMGEVVIYCDTSGSMYGTGLQRARGIVESVFEQVQPRAVTIVYGDARVNDVDRYEQGEPFVWRPQGGGGTRFGPALEWINQNCSDATCIVAISDMDGIYPDAPPDLPIIWLATEEFIGWGGSGRPAIAPFGETVYVGL